MAAANLPELIFTETDPAFNVVLYSLKELHDQGRLLIVHSQRAYIEDIESNDADEDANFRFGGAAYAPRKKKAPSAFGQTASAVIRMCMLEATQVKREYWPKLGNISNRRNKGKLTFIKVHPAAVQLPKFILAHNKENARAYWSKFDHLYPHFLIEDKVSGAFMDTQVTMNKMMIMFRNNFTEVVELITNFDATPRPGKVFNSYVNVTCIVRRIVEEDGVEDKMHTQSLKFMMRPAISIHPDFFENLKELQADQKEEDLDLLCAYFDQLNLGS